MTHLSSLLCCEHLAYGTVWHGFVFQVCETPSWHSRCAVLQLVVLLLLLLAACFGVLLS